MRALVVALAALTAVAVFAAAAHATPRAITTVAGNGLQGYTGDNGSATSAKLARPDGVAPLPGGGFLIADTDNNVIRKVSASGKISTVAGNGTGGYMGDNGPATSAELDQPDGVAPLPSGGFLIADTVSSVIRRVSPARKITTVAGTGIANYGGDNGPATSAELFFPQGVAPLPGGGFLIADSNNERIRKVSAAGQITTVAGDGTFGFGGDNGSATSAKLALPTAVAPTSDGFLIADSDNSRIRAVSAGKITTAAGTGTTGYSGDGGPATHAKLTFPKGVAALPGGAFLIADTQNDAIRKVSAAGKISTVAGRGPLNRRRPSRPAAAVRLNMPNAVGPLSGGAFLIADTAAQRIRWVGSPPKARITEHPRPKSRTRGRRGKVTFAFDSSQAHSSFGCKLDHARYRPCHSPKSYRVDPGQHTFRVKAVNQFHSRGRPAAFHFKIVHRR
jgi:hypothetical protein